MKKFGINGQLRNKLFLIVIHRFSLVKAAMNDLRICKMHNGVNNASISLSKCAMNIHRSHLNFCTIANLKTLKSSQMMGGGRIFQKNLRDTIFNKDLSNEPNFARTHLAGQYL
jgi:hypothetical protein